MGRKLLLTLAAVVALATIVSCVRLEPIGDGEAARRVAFVCRNGVSMSVWSAAYFNRLAEDRGLRERALARASTSSYEAVPLRMRFALALDGFRLDGYVPRVIGAEDARGALVVVIDDAELPAEARSSAAAVEVWQGFPPMREQYFPSRAALKVRVEELVDRFEHPSAGRE